MIRLSTVQSTMIDVAETMESEIPLLKSSTNMNDTEESQKPLEEKMQPPNPLGKARAILVSTLVVLTQLIQVGDSPSPYFDWR